MTHNFSPHWSIRESTELDIPQLRALLQTIWGEDEGSAEYYGWGRRKGMIAEKDGQIIGYAPYWRSALHPTFLYVGVHVHPDHRRQGLGERLWRIVNAELTLPIKSCTTGTQKESIRFLERKGLSVSVKTYLTELDLTHWQTENMQQWERKARDEWGVQLVSMANSDIPEEEWLRAHRAVYAHAHEHDPADVDILGKEDFLGADLNPHWLVGALVAGKLVGVASVRQEEPLPVLCWAGVTREWTEKVGWEGKKMLTLALTELALKAAALQGGVKRVNAELDSADEGAMHIREAFAWDERGIWLTFTTPRQEGTPLNPL